jgi:2'-5' RNA ligase
LLIGKNRVEYGFKVSILLSNYLLTTDPTYRIFVGAFITGRLAEEIQAVRLRWDPLTAKITPPHVTLAGTYQRDGPATPNNEAQTIQRLSRLYHAVEPFDLVLKGIYSFPPEDQPVIFLGVETTPGLLKARQTLQEILGEDKHRHFVPHLTLAMRLQGENARKAFNHLRSSDWAVKPRTFRVSELRLVQRGKSDPAWRCVATFPLTTNGRPRPCDQPAQG